MDNLAYLCYIGSAEKLLILPGFFLNLQSAQSMKKRNTLHGCLVAVLSLLALPAFAQDYANVRTGHGATIAPARDNSLRASEVGSVRLMPYMHDGETILHFTTELGAVHKDEECGGVVIIGVGEGNKITKLDVVILDMYGNDLSSSVEKIYRDLGDGKVAVGVVTKENGSRLPKVEVDWKIVVEGNVAGYDNMPVDRTQVFALQPKDLIRPYSADVIVARAAFSYFDIDKMSLNNAGMMRRAAGEVFAQMTLYPNPATSFANVRFSTDFGTPVFIRVLDTKGSVAQNVTASDMLSSAPRLDLSGLRPGMYMVEAQNDKGITERQKLIVRP